ncbi:MAG: hypothetical protein M3O07_11340 [Pseudomonadota bacterium]|nr:hypothetical protein [Pseudomonadota bacterium]
MQRSGWTLVVTAVISAIAAACVAQPPAAVQPPAVAAATPAPETARLPYSSTYQPGESGAILIRNATILTGTGTRLDGGEVLIENGRIAAIGSAIRAPDGVAAR